MKLGVILCAFDCAENLDDVVRPWLEASIDNDLVITAVHGQFKENVELLGYQEDRETAEILNKYKDSFEYIYFQEKDKLESEAEVRDYALQFLLKKDVTHVILLDGDEFFKVEEINNIFKFVSLNNLTNWFSINFKNYVFDGKQWIDGFCPPRVFKVQAGNFRLDRFYWDNDVVYKDPHGNDINYKQLSNMPIPKTLVRPKHLTWLHSNGKKKYEYQMKHFGHCGYKWNYEQNKLEFNLDFYKKNGLELPELIHD